MITNLAKNLHRKMGYPLGKVHYKMQLFSQSMKGFGSPMRHVRRVGYKTINFKETVARKLAAKHFIRELTPGLAARVKEFRENGFTYFTDQIDPKLMAELMKYDDDVISKRSEQARAVACHPFFFPLDDPNDWTTDNILVRFALQDSILQAVTAYFGCVPFLNGVSVLESRAVDLGTTAPVSSQQWHVDYSAGGDDQVGVWVHLTDVNTPDQGPFTFIPIPGSKKVKNGLFPRRIKDEEIEAFGLASQVRRATGPRATAFMINTLKCYHMGSRLAPGERRVVCLFSYVKPGPEKSFIKLTTPVPESKNLLLTR